MTFADETQGADERAARSARGGVREIELKFSVDPREADRLLRHPSLVAAVPRRSAKRLISTYFDVPGARLRRERMSFRIRRSEDGFVHTLKRGGLGDREEFEHRGGSEPDVRWLATTPFVGLLEDGKALEARFTVDVQRVLLPIVFRGAEIEVALDQGTIRSKGLVLPVGEVELELKRGRRRALFAFARRLARDLSLMPSLASKAERGYAVADFTWGQPTKETDLDLTGIRTIACVFRVILESNLHAMLRNIALINGGDDAEAVHRARIAVRRIRAAFALFRPALRRKRHRRVDKDIRWASDRLGEMRDADVFCAGMSAQGASKVDTRHLTAMFDDERGAANARLRKAIASRRWRLMCLDLIELAATGIRRARRNEPYRCFVRRRLDRSRSTLARRAKGLARRPMEALHEIRKSSKMLRYDIEFFDTVPKLATKRMGRLRDNLETMQETLGLVNDRHALHERLHALVARRPPPRGVSQEAWARTASDVDEANHRQSDDRALIARAARAARRVRRSKSL